MIAKINLPKMKQQKSWEVISINPFTQESKKMKHFLSSRSLNQKKSKDMYDMNDKKSKKKLSADIKNVDNYTKTKEESKSKEQNPIVRDSLYKIIGR
jgi:Rps23 Pro-64 3,4-dihydroxylase Tpa1-like proline 4-hydroxylase